MVDIYNETCPPGSFLHGATSVGVVPTRVYYEHRLSKNVLLKASRSNSQPVYVGKEQVTADATGTGGYPLYPGETLGVPLDDMSEIFVVSTVPNQVIHYIGA